MEKNFPLRNTATSEEIPLNASFCEEVAKQLENLPSKRIETFSRQFRVDSFDDDDDDDEDITSIVNRQTKNTMMEPSIHENPDEENTGQSSNLEGLNMFSVTQHGPIKIEDELKRKNQENEKSDNIEMSPESSFYSSLNSSKKFTISPSGSDNDDDNGENGISNRTRPREEKAFPNAKSTFGIENQIKEVQFDHSDSQYSSKASDELKGAKQPTEVNSASTRNWRDKLRDNEDELRKSESLGANFSDYSEEEHDVQWQPTTKWTPTEEQKKTQQGNGLLSHAPVLGTNIFENSPIIKNSNAVLSGLLLGEQNQQQEGVSFTEKNLLSELSKSPPTAMTGEGQELNGLAGKIISNGRSQNSTDIVHNEDVEMIMVKRNVYLVLKDWEEDRAIRAEKFNNLLDPFVDTLASATQSAKESNIQMMKFLKERSKLSSDLASRLRNSSSSSTKTLRHNVQPSSPSSSIAPSVEILKSETEGRAVPTNNFLQIHPAPLIKALYRCNEKEADYFQSFGEAIEVNMIQTKLSNATDDYEKAVHMLLSKLKEARSRLRSQNKDVRRAWSEFQKLFKETEKVQYSTSPHSTALPLTSQTRDTWLYERRYLHSAQIAHQMQASYLKLVIQGAVDAQQLEHWRACIAKDVLLSYMSKMRETLGLIASSLGSAHAMIDPEGFSKAKAEFFASQPSLCHDSPDVPLGATSTPSSARSNNISSNMNTVGTTFSSRSLPQSSENLTNSKASAKSTTSDVVEQPSAAASLKLENPGPSDYKTDFDTGMDLSFASAAALIDDVRVPETQLIIKKGHVRRHAGIFGKWSEGLLVLTWDRILHMFRSFDDNTPVWSVYVPSAEVRLGEEKSGTKTVEIRERKNLFVVLGSKSFYFRALSDDDLQSWLKCLTLAASADDRTYRTEGFANACTADQKAFDDYTNWVRNQETFRDDVLYIQDEESSSLGELAPDTQSNESRDF